MISFRLSPLELGRLQQVRERFKEESGEGEERIPGAFVALLDVKPIQQNGPQCGLVATSMALSYLGFGDFSAAALLERARAAGFSKQGEMFSAEDLAALAVSAAASSLSASVTAFPSSLSLLTEVTSGSAILVPYDSDKNNEPAQRNGHAAHWAIIAGAVVVDDRAGGELASLSVDINLDDVDSARIFVLAYHGKSKHLGVWEADALRASNAQLHEASPELTRNGDFVIKDETLGGLRDKIVVLRRQL